jgi:hypothetical protein
MTAANKKGSCAASFFKESGAGEESRTLDLNLGKVALYQLSYSRMGTTLLLRFHLDSNCKNRHAINKKRKLEHSSLF